MPTPSAFSLTYRADDTAIFIDSIQNFRVADFCCPADLLHLSPYPHLNLSIYVFNLTSDHTITFSQLWVFLPDRII